MATPHGAQGGGGVIGLGRHGVVHTLDDLPRRHQFLLHALHLPTGQWVTEVGLRRSALIARLGGMGAVVYKEPTDPGSRSAAREEAALSQLVLVRLPEPHPPLLPLLPLAHTPDLVFMKAQSQTSGTVFRLYRRMQGTLAEYAGEGGGVGGVGPRQVLRVAATLLRTLDIMHRTCGMHHCDLKPANVLYSGSEFVLSDFGSCVLAADAAQQPGLASLHQLYGTPGYMCPLLYPERPGFLGDNLHLVPADARALWASFAHARRPPPLSPGARRVARMSTLLQKVDLYALGVTLLWLLATRLPPAPGEEELREALGGFGRALVWGGRQGRGQQGGCWSTEDALARLAPLLGGV